MKDLQVFNYKGADFRTVEKDGDVWFVAKDVCDILGYANVTDALKKHVDEDERASVSLGRQGNTNIINEFGLYALILRSHKKEAKRFRRWVTHEVLPQIRKHGMYMTDKVMEQLKNDPEAFKQLLEKYTEERQKNKELQEQLASDRAYTNLGRVVLALPGSMTVQDAAHFLSQKGIPIGQNRLYKRCRDKKWLCGRKGKQYNQPTQKAIEKGLFNVQISGLGLRPVAMVTPQGLQILGNMFMAEYYPLEHLIEAQGNEGGMNEAI